MYEFRVFYNLLSTGFKYTHPNNKYTHPNKYKTNKSDHLNIFHWRREGPQSSLFCYGHKADYDLIFCIFAIIIVNFGLENT